MQSVDQLLAGMPMTTTVARFLAGAYPDEAAAMMENRNVPSSIWHGLNTRTLQWPVVHQLLRLGDPQIVIDLIHSGDRRGIVGHALVNWWLLPETLQRRYAAKPVSRDLAGDILHSSFVEDVKLTVATRYANPQAVRNWLLTDPTISDDTYLGAFGAAAPLPAGKASRRKARLEHLLIVAARPHLIDSIRQLACADTYLPAVAATAERDSLDELVEDVANAITRGGGGNALAAAERLLGRLDLPDRGRDDLLDAYTRSSIEPPARARHMTDNGPLDRLGVHKAQHLIDTIVRNGDTWNTSTAVHQALTVAVSHRLTNIDWPGLLNKLDPVYLRTCAFAAWYRTARPYLPHVLDNGDPRIRRIFDAGKAVTSLETYHTTLNSRRDAIRDSAVPIMVRATTDPTFRPFDANRPVRADVGDCTAGQLNALVSGYRPGRVTTLEDVSVYLHQQLGDADTPESQDAWRLFMHAYRTAAEKRRLTDLIAAVRTVSAKP